MGLFFLIYLVIPVAVVMALKGHKNTTSWVWAGIFMVSLVLGIAPFVAIAYLFMAYSSDKHAGKPQGQKTVTYHPDGSYTVYQAEDAGGPSPFRLAFRIVGGLIAGVVISAGLFVVGIILLFTLAPSVACGGSSKCY